MNPLTSGLAAGAAGTTLLNITTYLDMAIRGRPASSVPEDAVDRLAERRGISIDDDNRRSAIAALLGFATGLAAGAAYGLVSPLTSFLPRPVVIAAVGLGTMAATDASSASLGVTDPREWSAADWASDVVPHLAFGAGVVLVHDALSD